MDSCGMHFHPPTTAVSNQTGRYMCRHCVAPFHVLSLPDCQTAVVDFNPLTPTVVIWVQL